MRLAGADRPGDDKTTTPKSVARARSEEDEAVGRVQRSAEIETPERVAFPSLTWDHNPTRC